MQDPGSKKVWQAPFFSRSEYADRIARTSEAMRKAGVDTLIAFANKVMPGHVRYLSGYETRHGIHDWSIFLLNPESRACTLVTNVSWVSLREMSWVSDVRLTSLDRLAKLLGDWMPEAVKTIGIAGF